MNDLIRRQRALEKTKAKYRGKSLDWKRYDCVRMARSHLVAMGKKRLPKMPRYSSPLGARRALKAAGHDNLESLIDTILPRIAPAQMLPGDLLMVRGEGGFGSLMIWQDGGMAMGWVEGHSQLKNFIPTEYVAAWRG